MKKNLYIYYFPFAIVSILDIVFKFGFEKTLSLNPIIISQNGSFWKIFTYPLIDSSIISIFILGLVSFIFLPQILKSFSKIHFLILTVILILFQGLSQIVIFWGKDVTFSGYTSFSSFIMVLTVLSYPKVQLKKSHFFKLNNIQTVLILFLFLLSANLEKIIEGNVNQIFEFLFPIAFGSFFSFLVVFQIYLVKKYYLPKKQAKSINEIAELLTQARESMRKLESSLVEEPANIQQSNFEKKKKNYYELSEDPEENEDKLNLILDKMIAQGKDSLSNDEIKFLQKFSKLL